MKPPTNWSVAERFLEELVDVGCTHLVGLPDNTSGSLFELARGSSNIQIITVTREGEAFGLAAGLWIGGAVPVILIQNTGLLESGDAIRGTLVRMGLPVLCLVTFRGYRDPIAASDPAWLPNIHRLKDPMVDSVGLVTIRTIQAWGLTPRFLDEANEGLRPVLAEAEADRFPAVLLVRKPWVLGEEQRAGQD